MTMDLTPSDDLRAIVDTARTMLASHYPAARLREGAADTLVPLAEFGAFLIALPDRSGGMGLGPVEEALLHAALGEHLVTPSAITTAVAARIALRNGDPDLAEALTTGAAEACAGIADDQGVLLIEPDGAGHALIRSGSVLTLAAFDGRQAEPVTAMGHGRKITRLTRDADDDIKATPEEAQLVDLLACAHLLGVATGARDLAVAYAGTREQFGRPIGAFQAIKHHCANMSIGIEMLSAQLDMAAIAVAAGAPDADFQTAALARLAPRIALETARTGIQIHGGIGFSAEADAQLYLKQAHILRQMLGRRDLLSLPSPMAPTRRHS